ncbi:hypothetical protein ECG_05102 [Echinococcus granulosus]|nr:hypothetical protein ECG_05102 [Echinococcus granulosus]
MSRSVHQEVEEDENKIILMKQILLFLAEAFYPKLAQCLKICGAETPCELSVEEGVGRSAPEGVAVESSEVQHMKQFLLFLAEAFYPKLAQCLKICGAETPCELSVEEGIGRSAPEGVAVESSEVQHMKQFLLFLAEAFYPKLAQCLKICGAETPCKLSVEEGVGRSAPEGVAVESSEVQHMKQFLLFLAEAFYPKLAQCLKICGAETPCELSVEEGIGRSAPEGVAVESSEVQHMKQFLLFLAEAFYPKLAQCLKICGAETPCKLSVEEGVGRSAPEGVAVESSEVQHMKQFLLFLAEAFYPKLAQCLKICGAETPCELSVEEGVGRSAPEGVAVESSEVQHMKQFLLFLAEAFYPKLAQCLKICGAETPCELSVEEGIGRSAPEGVAVESSEVQHMKQFLLFLAEAFYPKLAQCLKICGAETPCELSVEEGVGRSAPEGVAVESSEVQHMKQFLLFLAEAFYPKLAQCLKICGAENTMRVECGRRDWKKCT